MSVEGEHHEKAVELLKAAPASVKLVVRYTPKVYFFSFLVSCTGFSVAFVAFQRSKFWSLPFFSFFRELHFQVLEEMEMRFDKQRQARRRQVYS